MRSVCSKVFIVYFNYCTQSMISPQAVCFFPRKDLETGIADLLSKQILTATGEREELLSSYFNQVWKNFVHVMSISPCLQKSYCSCYFMTFNKLLQNLKKLSFGLRERDEKKARE